jgi:hypothetical protein
MLHAKPNGQHAASNKRGALPCLVEQRLCAFCWCLVLRIQIQTMHRSVADLDATKREEKGQGKERQGQEAACHYSRA